MRRSAASSIPVPQDPLFEHKMALSDAGVQVFVY